MNKHIQMAVKKLGSQAELARRLNVSKGTVNSWVKGLNNVPPKKAEAIEKITGISAVLLVFPNRQINDEFKR